MTILKNDKAQFKAALRKYQHTHYFYWVDGFFVCEDDLKFCFCKMFAVFYTVNLYICVFTTCFTSQRLFDTLMDPWNVRTYVWIYERMCVFMHIHLSHVTALHITYTKTSIIISQLCHHISHIHAIKTPVPLINSKPIYNNSQHHNIVIYTLIWITVKFIYQMSNNSKIMINQHLRRVVPRQKIDTWKKKLY